MLTLLLLIGCASEPGLHPASAAVSTPAAEAPQISPHANRYGLTLGQSSHEDVVAWLGAHNLSCQQFPAPTLSSYYYRCEGDLPVSLLPDRTIHGKLTQLLISRPENAPIHHLSTLRKYSLAEDAIADFEGTAAAIEAELGTPVRRQKVEDISVLSRHLARFAAEWEGPDLSASVVLLKATGGFISVTETWTAPALKASVTERPRDGSVQGGEGKRPHGWNPHVTETPTLTPR